MSILGSMRLIALPLLLSFAAAQPPAHRVVEDLTQGIRFAPPFIYVAEAPSDPDALYLASAKGRVFITQDAGLSWGEFELLVEKGRFFGVRRPQKWPRIVTHDGGTFFVPKALSPAHVLAVESPDITDRYEPANRYTRKEFNDLTNTGDFNVYEAKTYDSPRAAGKLAWWVRQKKGWALGVKLKLNLFMMPGAATGINFLDVNPSDPQDILAGTQDGLYRSVDGGYSWSPVLGGASKAENLIMHIVRHPNDPNKVYAGTGKGLKISQDGGDTWIPAEDPFASINGITSIAFNPKNPDEILLGMFWGILKTTNGGKKFELIFTHSWPDLKHIHHVIYDPHNSKRIFAATKDGLLISEDGGKNFERGPGGTQFTGLNVESISAGAKPGHFILASPQDLWETFDSGKNWQIILFGAGKWAIRDAHFSMHDGEVIWVVTSAEILRIRPSRGGLAPDISREFEEIRRKEPSLGEVVQIALRRAGVDRPFVNSYRQRSALSMYIPDLVGALSHYDISVENARELWSTGEDYFIADGDFSYTHWYLGLKINLAETIFSKKESVYDLQGWLGRDAEKKIRETLTSLYQERRRLQIQQLLRPDVEGRAKLMRDLRMEELTAHINALAGNVLPPFEAL